MKNLTKILALTAIVICFIAGNVMASPMNLRPDPTVPANDALQTYFDSVGQNIDVIADQSAAALFMTSTSQNSAFTIMLENAGYASTNVLGIYNSNDLAMFPIFIGSDDPKDAALVMFNAGGVQGQVVVNVTDSNSFNTRQAIYQGVNSNSFGFYLDSLAGTFYTEDYLNPSGLAQALVYEGTGASDGDWWIAFEDLDRSSGADDDFDDIVIEGQSITPIPEPGTLMLLGSGLAGVGFYTRRRKNK